MDLFVVLTWIIDVLGAAVEINPMMPEPQEVLCFLMFLDVFGP